MLMFKYVFECRVPSAGQGGGRDVLRDDGGVAGRSPRADRHGGVPDLLPGLAGHVPPRRRARRRGPG